MEFKILGPLEVSANGAIVDVTAPKQRAVLAILLVAANRVVSLDRLTDQLYGGHPPDHAVGSVQAYVSHLRRMLEPQRPRRGAPQVLLSRPSGYVLAVEPLHYDAACFEVALQAGKAAVVGARPAAAVTAFDTALGLWRGPALAEFAHEPFARAEATRLEELRAAAVEWRLDAHLALGDDHTVIAEAERGVAEHPLRERLWFALILALYRAGRQSDALRVYQKCRAVLGEELGVEPGAELRRLELDVLRQSESLDWRHPPPEPAGHAPGTATAAEPRSAREARPEPPDTATRERRPSDPDWPLFVGRDLELDRLSQAWAHARQGRGAVALIGGEAGIGKTTIVETFARRALTIGETMVGGLGHEGDGAPAFWMWGQIFRALAAAGSSFDTALIRAGIGRSDLRAMVPDWSEPTAGLPTPTDPIEARFGLYRDATAVLRAFSATVPVVVLLDDLQWADMASLALLEFVAPRLRDASVLVVGAYRDDDISDGQPLAGTLAALARLPATLRLFPRPLTAGETGSYLSTVTGEPPRGDVVEVICARTEGNPFFLTELVKLLTSERSLDCPMAAGTSAVPASVREVIRRRLARLPEQTKGLLALAAVIGPDFDFDILEAVSQLDDNATEEALELAVVSGIVVDNPTGIARYRFSHALIRETIYYGMSTLRRARLHARVADALEGLPHADAAALAHHSCEAASAVGVERAVAASLRAADAAQAALAIEQAEELLHRAIDLVAIAGGGQRLDQGNCDRLELQVQSRLLGLRIRAVGYTHPGVERAGTRILQLCRSAPPGDSEIVSALVGLGGVHIESANWDAAAATAQTLLDSAGAIADSSAAIAGHLMLGVPEMYRGHLASAEEHFALAVAGADSLPGGMTPGAQVYGQDPTIMGRAFRAITCSLRGDQSRSEELMGQALDLARATGHPFSEMVALFPITWLAAMLHDAPTVRHRVAEMTELSCRLGYAPFEAPMRMFESWAIAYQGEADQAIAALQEGIDRYRAAGIKVLRSFFLDLLAEVQIASGRIDDALVTIRLALGELAVNGERFYQAELHRLHGELLAMQPGSGAQVESELRQALSVARQQGSVLLRRRAETSLAAHVPSARQP